jgi:gamma-glutamyltranspeptidase/glutathione hydrolase
VLASGGNAVDACIAAAAASWVVESTLTGPGGGGFMLVHRASDRRDVLLDFSVAIPGLGLDPGQAGEMEVVHLPFGAGDTTQAFHVGAASCAVPGTVAGLAAAHELLGTVPWPELLAPAVALARDGFELAPMQAVVHRLLEQVLHRDEAGHDVYGPPDSLRAGERIALPDLAAALELIADRGADDFYRGDLARAIAAASTERGGRITGADLASFRVIRRRPVRVRYRDMELVSNPPPSSGGILIAYALRLLDLLGVGGPPGSAEAIARLAEVARETARARTPSFVAALHRGGLPGVLLSDERVELAAAAIERRGARAGVLEPSGLPSTTHLSVLDADGNAASLSSSLGCGSGVFVPGTGIHLNNMLGEVDLNPHGHGAGPVGRRLTSMMSPSVLLLAGRPRLVVGSAGSERLRGAILQTVVNVADHDFRLQAAIEAPRSHLAGDVLHVEGGHDERELERLETMGYTLARWPGPERNLFFGGVAAVGRRADGTLEAVGDVRRGGAGVVVAPAS